jgi:TRAP-type C4-dicarboxylate transport system permease small subunit
MHGVIERLVRWALAAILGFMTCLVFAGVLFRYLLNLPLTWTEELASLLFAWLTFVGAFVGFRTRSHIAIDSLMLLLPPRIRDAIARLADLVILLLLALFVWQGISLTMKTWSLEFPAMEISRGYLYLSLPMGAGLMIVAVLKAWADRRLGVRPADDGEVPL